MPRAFIIRPFGTKPNYDGIEIDFEKVEQQLIHQAFEQSSSDYVYETTEDIWYAGNIRADMFKMIISHDLVIADISIHNANVFYELGIRHAMRKKHTILIRGDELGDDPPFDIATDRYFKYDNKTPSASVADLTRVIDATTGSETTSSPIFLLVPQLPEIDHESVVVAPEPLMREIAHAVRTNDKGMLRLLRDEISDTEFENAALRHLARAQTAVVDIEEAIESWKSLPNTANGCVEVYLELAKLYSRRHESNDSKESTDLERSNEQINLALDANTATPEDQTRALNLKADNLKASWLAQFINDNDLDIAQRRNAAAVQLRRVYEAYADTYDSNFNNHEAAIRTFFFGNLILDFLEDPGDLYISIVDMEADKKGYADSVSQKVSMLSALIPSLLKRNKAQINPDSTSRLNDIESFRALFLLLSDKEVDAVRNLYRAIHSKSPIGEWDAAQLQLKLIGGLGLVNEELCQDIINYVNQAREPVANKTTQTSAILFAGHGIDHPDDDRERFPTHAEDRARKLILQKLTDMNQLANTSDQTTVVIASGYHGADILCHEVCDAAQIRSILCLPTAPKHYERTVFEHHPEWKNRYLEISRERQNRGDVWIMSEDIDLPNWLESANDSVWTRGSRWIVKRIQSADYSRKTLIAFWDDTGLEENNGGTGHIVRLGRAEESMFEELIDARKLLN